MRNSLFVSHDFFQSIYVSNEVKDLQGFCFEKLAIWESVNTVFRKELIPDREMFTI
jgi:hypothetical protein